MRKYKYRALYKVNDELKFDYIKPKTLDLLFLKKILAISTRLNHTMKGFLLYALFLVLSLPGRSQQVFVSDELSLKNDFAYFLVPHRESCLLIRDKAFKLVVQSLNDQLNWSSEHSIELKGKKWKLIEVVEHQDQIGIFYLAKEENESALWYSVFSSTGEAISHKALIRKRELIYEKGFKITKSEDSRWFCLGFGTSRGERELLLYQREQDSVYFAIKTKELVEVERETVKEMVVSNEGHLFMLGMKEDGSFMKHKLVLQLFEYGPKLDLLRQQKLEFSDNIPSDIQLSVHNLKNQFTLVGLYLDKKEEIAGFFYYIWKDGFQTKFTKLSEELIKKWTGKTSYKHIDLITQSLRWKVDGSLILFCESNKQYHRRPYFATSDQMNMSSKWVDYYFDEVIVACFDHNGEQEWSDVLFKKQFSQDDEGYYSSFFIVETKDFFRILFNDEIKSQSTVSEYILSPSGKNLRKSVLNTTQQKLQLRIVDALQRNADRVIIPSEVDGKLQIVQIDF